MPAIRSAIAPQSPAWATATDTSEGLFPSAVSAPANSVPDPDRKLAPFMLSLVAVAPHSVPGSSASRSLAWLGRLGSAKLGAPPEAATSEDVASDAATDASVDGAAADAGAWDAVAADGIGVAAPPHATTTIASVPDASAAMKVRDRMRHPPECAG